MHMVPREVAIWEPQVHESRTYIHDPKSGVF